MHNLSILETQRDTRVFVAFSHTIFVFIAPNLVYLHNLDINKVGSVSGTNFLLHLSHCSSLCDAHIWRLISGGSK